MCYNGGMINNIQEYEEELQTLKPWDQVQYTKIDKATGLPFIITCGHGYMVVPMDHKDYEIARNLCIYGYRGDKGIYLEEDREAEQFTNSITR